MYVEPYLLAAVVAFFVTLAICSELRARRHQKAVADALQIQREWQVRGYFHAHRLIAIGMSRDRVLLLMSADTNPHFIHGMLQRLDERTLL